MTAMTGTRARSAAPPNGSAVRSIGSVYIASSSLFSTHHASAQDVLAGRVRERTAPTFPLVVARARRFTSLVTQMHLEVCGAVQPTGAAAAVFATCHGEIETAENLIADFRDSQHVSSARFALSVHNTPSGVYSVALGDSAPTTTVTGSNAIAAGWLEAALTALDGGRVLLSIADEPVPAVFRGPTQPVGVAAAFVLSPAGPGPRIELVVAPATDDVEIDTLATLASIVDAIATDRAATIPLGRIQPGAVLELRFGEGGRG